MTLSDMAQFVCTKINMSAANDLAACKTYLQRRFEMIWNECLWKDSLISFTSTVSPSGSSLASALWIPSRSTFVCPTIVDRVMAVRSDQFHMNVQRQEYYFRVDFDAFNKQGRPSEFVLLSPVVWEVDSAASFSVLGNVADAGIAGSLSYLDTDNISEVVLSFISAGTSWATVTTEAIVAFGKATTQNDVTIVSPTSGNLIPAGSVYNGAGQFFLTLTSGQTYLFSTGANEGNAVQGLQSWNAPQSNTFFTAQTFSGNCLLTFQSTGFTPGIPVTATLTTASLVATCPAANKTIPRRQRFRLVISADPTQPAINLRILAKVRPPTFSADNDEPRLTNIDNTLLAFAHSDMLVRGRQYTKAAQVAQEASMLLDQLKRLEMVQQAHNARLIPEDGYGNEYDLRGHSPLSF